MKRVYWGIENLSKYLHYLPGGVRLLCSEGLLFRWNGEVRMLISSIQIMEA